MGMLNNNGSTSSNAAPVSILADVRAAAATASAPAAGTQSDRKVSDYWLNVGVTLEGTDGKPVFVSLPQGLPLDDMKPQVIRGNNADFIHLAQTKNALLEAVQKAAATLAPGERKIIDVQVEVYRRAEPAQQGDVHSNPLLSQLVARVGG